MVPGKSGNQNSESLLAQNAPEVVKGGGKPLRQRISGLPAGIAELVGTGAGMLYIPGAFRSVEHLGGGTGCLDDIVRQLFNGDLAAVPGIKHAGHSRMLRHEGEGPHNVLHVNEVARLGSVSVNGDILVLRRSY